jgi:hypothetical protein
MWRTTAFTLLIMSLVPGAVVAQRDSLKLDITFERDSDRERATAEQLRRTVQDYDVGAWVYTRRIHIDERSIPHSHPVLTVHTRHLGDEHGLLATFLHEQFHWLEDGNVHFGEAMSAFAEAYPDAPAGGPEGARDLESTYRHLLVCDLEFQAMTKLVGEPRAREILGASPHYTWIYDRVLHDPGVREIVTANGFLLDGVGSSARGLTKR